MILLAVDIGGTNHSVALVSADARRFGILHRLRRPTDRAQGRRWLLPRIESACRELMARADERPVACGIGFGGPVDFRSQTVRRSMHAGGWGNFPLAARLGDALGLPCVMDNDANTAALGEFSYGAGRGSQSMVYLTVSTGIGGGLVLDGNIYRGARSLAGEFGHTPLEPDGPRCSCGRRGCVEAVCSGSALGRAARDAARRNPRAWRAVGTLEAKAVFEAARRGHPAARRLVETYCDQLGRALAALIALLDPNAVVIGGGVSLAGPALFVPLRRAIARHLPPFLAPFLATQSLRSGLTRSLRSGFGRAGCRCLPAALGENSVLAGAAHLALSVTSSTGTY